MKTILSQISLFLFLLPAFALAAFNDVTLTTSTVLSVGSYTLNVTGSSAVIQSITVNSGSFTVTMLAGSYLQVTSPTFQQLTTDNPGLVSSNACSTGNSVLTLSSPSSSGSVTVTPQSTICSTPAPSGGGGGGGYTDYNSLVLSTTPTAKPTPTPITVTPATTPGLNLSGPPSGAHPSFPSNTLVNDHGTIYLISGQTKIGFTSMTAFRGLGYKLQNVILGDASGYEASPKYILSSALMAHPWGLWLLYKKTVYYATAQGMVPVPSWQTLLSNGGQAKYIVPMNAADLQTLRASPTLPVMTAEDSRVVR